MEYPIWFVCVLGIGVVFIGLVCIVLLCKTVSFCCKIAENTNMSKVQTENVVAPVSASPVAAQPIQNRQKIVAAVSAAIAEELGTDVSAIRVVSFKRI